MPDNSQKIFEILSKPGVKRDGTPFDCDYYSSAQWARFQRGRPKKIGGYRAISDQITGPVRSVYVDSRQSTNSVHTFSPWGIQRLQVDDNGSGGAVYDRTPAGFARNDDFTWSVSAMYSQTGGAYTALIAASTPDQSSIASDANGSVYAGNIIATNQLTQISDNLGPIAISGGCAVIQPFLFVYGSNGLIRNSNANDFSSATGWTTGGSNFSNSANVCGTKVIKGLPMRGGSVSPSGLFWSLDSLVRVTFAGSTILWRYDTVSASITVLAKNSIIEYDGLYYWCGVDRFFVYNGVVQELPNQMNLNWFFDNLNYAQRQKVFAVKVPRYGEIWWFYPRGNATECTNVIIFNVREGTWYDNTISRSAGYESQVFAYPIMAGGEDSRETANITYVGETGNFKIGDIVTGATSGRSGTVVRSFSGILNLNNLTGSATFVIGEQITNGTITATLSSNEQLQQLDVVWQHEFGTDKIYNGTVAIQSYIETANFSYPTGGPSENIQPTDIQSRVLRVDPDFIQSGEMNMYIKGQSYPNSPVATSQPYPFSNTDEYVSVEEQRRICTILFESNVAGGDFEMGQVMVTVETGDAHG